ncbi:MAG: tetratricopeptide repeat protein [Firmicutes bacterium]|nr:tetratricopeptide repeat protein [Bacillota bacterium]
MGRVDRPKGLLKTKGNYKNIIPLQQDVNYYFQKGSYYHRKNKLSKALLFLKKAIEIDPGNAESHYHLACLLSKSSRLQEANRIFKHVVSNLDPGFTDCYFLMALNYGLMDDMPRARRYLRKYLQVDPQGEMAGEAYDLLEVMEDDLDESNDRSPVFSGQENEALEKWLSALDSNALAKNFSDEDFIFLLQRGLYQGGDSLKEKIIRLCGMVKSDTAAILLRGYIINPWVKERLRRLALVELKKIYPKGSVLIFSEGQIVERELSHELLSAPVWCDEWTDVLNCTFAHMRRSSHYGEEFFQDARAIWLDYINQVYPHMPRIVKIETWAAGLEYCLARFHFLNLTQEELAGVYGVSPSSVGRKYKQINALLQIDQKAYRNMLAFLAYHDRED